MLFSDHATNWSMRELVNHLQHTGVLHNTRAINAMLATDRADFCSHHPYTDAPQTIGFNATISAPHMHAFALEAAAPFLAPARPLRVLDVGSGSGYLSVALAHLAGPASKIYGIEHIQPLVDLSRRNTEKQHAELLQDGRIHFICEDGRKGFPPGAPYDVIHVGASSEDVPSSLIEQTRVGGVIIIPVGAMATVQHMRVLTKTADGTLQDTSRDHLSVRYVPLTDAKSQLTQSN